ncbi:putative transposase-like protein [Trichonephila clavipes]|nr:putative transposase-like protein [Trichonephila clavipes]
MKVVSDKSLKFDCRISCCRPSGANSRCRNKKSIRLNSFFSGSKLPISNILLLMYEFFRRSSFAQIHKELGIFGQAFFWRHYACDVLIDHIVVHTEKAGGGKTVEIDGSKIGKRKCNRGHFAEGQWVCGGVERKTERCFLVAVHDKMAETLLGLIESWIEPGTTVISDCWKSYERLSERGYHHLTVNHSLKFVDSETRAQTWQSYQASLHSFLA